MLLGLITPVQARWPILNGVLMIRKKVWHIWAKALGEKASLHTTIADKVAIVRTIILLVYLITNFVIIAGVIHHW